MSDWLQKIKNAIIGGAVAESPAVMTASGWQQDREGNWKQEHSKGSQQLAENIAIIGEAGITAPTLVSDIGLVIKGIRHPIRTAKTVGQAVQDMLWFLKNPKATKVYHVNRQGKIFNLQDSRTASSDNIGIHVTPDINIARTFNQNASVMEAYIPKHNAETIDIGSNDYRLLSNDIIFDSRPESSMNYHDAAGEPKLLYNLLQKYKANPIKKGNKIYTSKRVSIPLRDETFPNLPLQDQQKLDKIIEEGSKVDFSLTPQKFNERATRLNQQANDILSKNGKKVIKYINTNPAEVHQGKGVSYIITDPNVFYVPGRYSLDIGRMLKYPIIIGNEHVN